MVIIIALGIVASLILGTGAGKGDRRRYSIGFWSLVILGIVSFFVASVAHAIFFVAGMLALTVLSWLASLSGRINKATKD